MHAPSGLSPRTSRCRTSIRRRRHEPEHASAEHVRLTDALREIQAGPTCAESLMRTDRDPLVRDAFATPVRILRVDAGGHAAAAWKTPPIERDDQMGMQDVHAALARLCDEQERFERIARTGPPHERTECPPARPAAAERQFSLVPAAWALRRSRPHTAALAVTSDESTTVALTTACDHRHPATTATHSGTTSPPARSGWCGGSADRVIRPGRMGAGRGRPTDASRCRRRQERHGPRPTQLHPGREP